MLDWGTHLLQHCGSIKTVSIQHPLVRASAQELHAGMETEVTVASLPSAITPPPLSVSSRARTLGGVADDRVPVADVQLRSEGNRLEAFQKRADKAETEYANHWRKYSQFEGAARKAGVYHAYRSASEMAVRQQLDAMMAEKGRCEQSGTSDFSFHT